MKKLFVFFVLLWAALFFLNSADKAPAEKIVQLQELTKPSRIQVDGDGIYVVNNRYNIIIYSLKDFKLKNQFGKKGEGPGEFKYTLKLLLRPDVIFIDSQDRISWFSKKGKFLKQKNKSLQSSYIPFQDKFIVKSTQFLSYQKHKTELGICDSGFKKIKKLHEFTMKMPLIGGSAPQIKEWKMILPYVQVSYDITSGKIFVFDTQKGFYINVFDENGHNLYTINKDKEIEKIEVPEEYKDKRRKEFKQDPFWLELQKPKLIFPEYFPSYRWANVNHGKIYVQTYKKKDNKTQFLVLDLKGKILKEIYLPVPVPDSDLRKQTVYKNKLYKLVENEEKETWELHVYKM
jgi:hypothetical protein